MTKVSVVIPVFNNVDSINITVSEVIRVLRALGSGVIYELILVNDGSSDSSWDVMNAIYLENQRHVKLINLVRNFGQVRALLAGYKHASGDAIISMAADMQDPPELIPDLFREWRNGHKLVLGNRVERNDGFFNDFLSSVAWRVLKRFALPALPRNGFDYFLMDARVKDRFITDPDQYLFLQGRLLYFVGGTSSVDYKRARRLTGRSQTSSATRIKYLIDGLTGYSYAPLRLMSLIGIVTFIFSVVGAVFIILQTLSLGSKVEGWASIMVVLLALGGFQLLSLGVLGEYIWRNLEETRKRPHYVVDEFVGFEDEKGEETYGS